MKTPETETDRLLNQARAKARSERLWARLDKWEAERLERDAEQAAKRADWLERYRANVTQADGFAMTCGKCGHVGNFDDFTTDRLGFDRGPDLFQCPACNFAIKREKKGEIVQLTPIQSTL